MTDKITLPALHTLYGDFNEPPLAQVFTTSATYSDKLQKYIICSGLPKSALVPDYYLKTYHVCVRLVDSVSDDDRLHWVYDLPNPQIALSVIESYYPDITCQIDLSTETVHN